MAHPLVDQLRAARAEWQRLLTLLPPADAERPIGPLNSVAWMVAHLAHHEHGYFVAMAQGREAWPNLDRLIGWGGPATTPPLETALAAWRATTAAADAWLETLDAEQLAQPVPFDPPWANWGTALLLITYHYWYHIGEAHAAGSLAGHKELGDFPGAIPAMVVD